MTPPASALLRDLLAYSLQLAVLVGAAALLARLLPLRPPRVALSFWQILLLASLALPFGQPRREQPAAPPASIATAAVASSPVASAPAPPVAWPRALLIALAAGVAARGAWIALGLWQLRGMRRNGRPLARELAPLAQARALVGADAEFYASNASDVPITFGLRRPAVLLPEAVLEMPAQTQHAIACHELLHVRRRDWAWAVAEECTKGLLWFHPAIAWLVSRIQLAREQAVDRDVVALTRSREDYVGALLAVARARQQPGLLAATPFLRRGRLKQRVAEILEEGIMSRTRQTLHLAVSASAVTLALAAGLRLFPLEARASAAAADDHKPVQILRGGEKLLHAERIEYPKRAIEKQVSGEVVLSLDLDERGEVQDARVISGPEELRAAALRSVLRWHYAPSAGPATVEVVLQFRPPTPEQREAHEIERAQEPRPDAETLRRQVEELNAALADPAVSGERRERYEHQLREREEALLRLKRQMHEIEKSQAAEADTLALKQAMLQAQHRELEAKALQAMAQRQQALQELERSQAGDADTLALKQAMLQAQRQELEARALQAMAQRQQALQSLQDAELEAKTRATAERRIVLEHRGMAVLAAQQQEVSMNSLVGKEKLAELQAQEEVLTHALEKIAEATPEDEAKLKAAERNLRAKLREAGLPGRLSAIHAARLSPETLQALLPQLGVAVGDTLDVAALARVKAAVARFDEHLRVEVGRTPDGGMILLVVGP
jgi:TonB family protein